MYEYWTSSYSYHVYLSFFTSELLCTIRILEYTKRRVRLLNTEIEEKSKHRERELKYIETSTDRINEVIKKE